MSGIDKKNIEYIPYCPFGPYHWVIIKYDGHDGFACDWGDCLEEMYFIDGYDHCKNYIEYCDKKLTHFEPMMCKNKLISDIDKKEKLNAE